MCIISSYVKKVSKTKIFTMPSQDSKRQLTVYMNSVDSPVTNIMCLPVPNPDSVQFEKVPKNLFNFCEASFPEPIKEPEMMWSLSLSRTPLEIKSHGSYEVVLIPSSDDFDRIPDSFELTEAVQKFLIENYSKNFGFLLCRLKKGSVRYEPFAYSHDIQDTSLFVPTKHFHIHADTDFISRLSFMPKLSSKADWDHDIYTCFIPIQLKDISHDSEIEWEEMPKGFRCGPDYPLQRLKCIGNSHKNEDLSFYLTK